MATGKRPPPKPPKPTPPPRPAPERVPVDIYKRSAIATPSDEHVLLNALGGHLTGRALIDKTTNDVFGSGIDAALGDALLTIRVLLGAEAGDGTPPPPYRNAVAPDGLHYTMRSGGRPEISAPRVTFGSTPDGRTTIEGRARSLAELRRLTARKLGQLKIPFERIEAAARTVEERAPMLSMPLSFTPESQRAVAKMCCNLLALRMPDLFLRPTFDHVRDFVLTGAGDVGSFVVINTKPVDINVRRKALGPLDHLLLVKSNPAGTVEGLVALYGHIQFCVRLGRASEGDLFGTSYRVDQLGRVDRRDDPRDMALPVREFDKVSNASNAARWHAVRSDMHRVLKFVVERQREAVIQEMIEHTYDETIGPPDGSVITQEKIEAFSAKLGERFARHLELTGQLEGVLAGLEAKGVL